MKLYHGKDLRKGRFFEKNRIYFVTTVTWKREPFFQDWQVGRVLVRELKELSDAEFAESMAWVVMPDHLHWLCSLGDTSLEILMRRIKSRSAIGVNRCLGRRGRVWQKGYHDHAVRREEDLSSIARYLVANPLRAGLVKRLGDYPLWDAKWV